MQQKRLPINDLKAFLLEKVSFKPILAQLNRVSGDNC
jgi:hypothetical protein